MPGLSGNTLHRLGRYGLVGILGTLVYYTALWLLVEVFHVLVMVSTSIAFILVTIENYLLHYLWTFNSDASHQTAFPRFVLMNIIGFCLNWLIMYVGVHSLVLNYLWVQAVAIVVVVIWNYVLGAVWIFRDKHSAADGNITK
jgi:putative flippase GtrA